MVDEVSLKSLLSLEKSLFFNSKYDSELETVNDLINFHTKDCSSEVMEFYWNINHATEQLLLQDACEAKFRLRHAVINNNLLFVAIYLRHTGDANITDESKQSPLHWSTTAEMVRLLLSYGADLNHQAVSGRTALHNCNTVEATEELLKAGLSPHKLNKNHGSPLHNGFISSGMTRVLLKYGADPNTVNYYGHTPLHVVASRGTWEVVYYLLCGGCDCSIVGRDGMSALSLARMVQSNVLQGNPRKIAIPQEEFVRLDKTIELLCLWQDSLHQGCNFNQTKYKVSKYCSWKAQALLCKDPLGGYREAMGNKVPEDVINEIIVHFVGPEGPRVNSYSKFNKMSSFRRSASSVDKSGLKVQSIPEYLYDFFSTVAERDAPTVWLLVAIFVASTAYLLGIYHLHL